MASFAPVSTALSDGDIAELSARFEHAPATSIIRWAIDQFHPELSLLSSMTDALLIDLAVRVEPSIEVVFIDTGYHFPETLDTVEAVRRRHSLNLRVMQVPSQGVEPWVADPHHCCSVHKVAQLERALEGKQAWMTGLRRSDGPGRANTPIIQRDPRGLIKVNPLATWSDEDACGYIADHDVPVNPLLAQGYQSIGCAPCTAAVADGEHARAGRWPGREKTECGLHA